MYPRGQGKKILVVGAGPVGALAAIYASRRGYQVEVYELRNDLTLPTVVPLNFTKSINLTLSERGIQGLSHSGSPGLLEDILSEAVPVYGRMVHGKSMLGTLTEKAMAYDVHGRHLRVLDREKLNKRLLRDLETDPNVQIFYNHQLVSADFNNKKAVFKRTFPQACSEKQPPAKLVDIVEKDIPVELVEVSFDQCIGADGAHSATRHQLTKHTRVDFQQTWIDTFWCEFSAPAAADGGYRMSPNHLHIWPHPEFMFFASPDINGTFTCNLFASEAVFLDLEAGSSEHLVAFFNTHFPGVIPDLIRPEAIHSQFFKNRHLPLLDIKCRPYHYRDTCVIVGDAAHAMVPFYGQGMNTGFEDVRLLFEEFLDKDDNAQGRLQVGQKRRDADTPFSNVLERYTNTRIPDVHAMNALALQNYEELRIGVKSYPTLARKWIEEFLELWCPRLHWATLYSRVAFGNERMSEVTRKAQKQKNILQLLFGFVVLWPLSLVAAFVVLHGRTLWAI